MGALSILKKPLRCWRAKGHGIHSPFAYRFVTDVLCLNDDYGYYAYDQIAAKKCSRREQRWMRTITRLKASYPDELLVVGDKMACQADLESHHVIAIADITQGCGSELWQQLSSLDRGMTFTNHRSGVVCLFKHLPRQSFVVNF